VNVIHELPEAHAIGALTLDWAEGGLATGGQDGKVRLWDASRATVLETFDAAEGNRSTWVEQVRWSPDGTRLAGRAGKVLRIWKPSAGNSCRKYDEHSTTVSALCWRPDSQGIAVGLYGGARFTGSTKLNLIRRSAGKVPFFRWLGVRTLAIWRLARKRPR
jgi:WD40 repeat protein